MPGPLHATPLPNFTPSDDVKGLLPVGGLIALVGALPLVSNKLLQLEDEDCVYVQLAQWTATDDPGQSSSLVGGPSFSPADAGDYPIYYGFNGVLFAQLFPGETTQLLPVSNARQVCAKTGNVHPDLILRYVIYKQPR